MADLKDMVTTSVQICEACLRGGTVVEMEPLANVTQGNKRKCPTCEGTKMLILMEMEWPAEE